MIDDRAFRNKVNRNDQDLSINKLLMFFNYNFLK